jgi:hypothetical protein
LAATTPGGEQVFLVPVKPPTAAAAATYLSHLGSKLPDRVRKQIRAIEEQEERQGDILRIAFMRDGQVEGSIGGGLTAKSIEHGPAGFLGGEPGLGTNVSRLVQVVPDGVAKVTLLVPVLHQDGPTTLTKITQEIHNNVLVARVPEAPDEQRQETIWYGPTGKVLRCFGKINHPPATHAATCSPSRRFLCGRPPSGITSMLGSLSRRPSPAQRISQDFLRTLAWQGSGIYVRYARRGKYYGVPYYLFPASNVGGKCCAGQPGVQLIIEYAGDEIHDYISLQELRDHVAPKSIQAGLTLTPLVVPDQVASVTAKYPARGSAPPQVLTEPAKNNIVMFLANHGGNPSSLTYRSATGAVLWSTRPR